MYKIAVGEKFPGFIPRIGDGVQFQMDDGGATLLLSFSSPTEKEILDIKKGKLQFGMFVRNNIIFMLTKFGSMPWMDAPFHVALTSNLTKLQDVKEGQGYSCTIILVDSTTGIVKALRHVSFDTNFSRKLKQNIEAQILDMNVNTFNEMLYDAKVSQIMKNYTTKDMVKFSEVNCRIK